VSQSAGVVNGAFGAQCKEVQWFNCRPLPIEAGRIINIRFSIYSGTDRVRLNFFF